MKDVGSLLLVLKVDDDFQYFDGDVNDIVWAASFIVIFYFEQTVCRITSNTTFESKNEKNFPNSLGKQIVFKEPSAAKTYTSLAKELQKYGNCTRMYEQHR